MQNDDFDPFDLSAPPRVINDPKTMISDFAPKPTVHRVSMGPIFHSRVLRIIALVLAVILFALFGYIGANYRISKNQISADTSNTKVASGNLDSNGDPITIPKANYPETTPSTTTPTTQTPTTTQTQTTTTPTTQTQTSSPVYCGVAGMPEGVCTTIKSVEQNGLKGNPYLTPAAITQANQLPNGTVVTVDEATWKANGSDKGSVKFSANLNGPVYSGTGQLQLINNKWMITGYILGA